MQVVNKTGYSTEMYTDEAQKIIDSHNTSEVSKQTRNCYFVIRADQCDFS